MSKLQILPVLAFVLSLLAFSVGGATYMHVKFATLERLKSDIGSVNTERKDDIKEIKTGIEQINKKIDRLLEAR